MRLGDTLLKLLDLQHRMKEHIYTAKRRRIISQSFFIWVFVALQLGATIAFATSNMKNPVTAIIFINVLLSFINIPSVKLFIRYYRHSAGKRFTLTYNSLRYADDKTGETIEIINAEIEKIFLVENPITSRLPWLFHEYFVFMDSRNNKIIITSYFMDIADFWMDTLARRVDSDKLIREEKLYPWF